MFEQTAQDTSGIALLVWNGILAIVAIAGGVGAYVCQRRVRAMAATRTSRIGNARGGYVEFEGHSKDTSESGIKGPLTGTPCVWYEYEITKQVGGHRRDSHSRWVTVDRGRSEDLFVLRDATGECLVDPDGAKVITAPADTDRWIGRSDWPTRGPAKRGSRGGLFPGQGFSTFSFGQGMWFSTRKNFRYAERRIPPDAPLYALGHLDQCGAGAGSAGESVAERLRAWKRDHAGLLRRFDADGDGQIDANEWDAARREATAQVAQERAQTSGAQDIAVLGAPRDRSQPFLISAIPQRALIARYRLYTGIGLIAAVAAGIGMGVLIAGS
jgi:hypothetical protein